MGFYAERILPRLLDKSLDRAEFATLRRAALADVRGEILEIGFGTGLNLPHYPATVRRLTAVDSSAGMSKLARQRIAASAIAVDQRVLDGARLPFADDSFDTVVSTFTLCSIGEVQGALRELRRVLKPGGRFHFVEHGLSDDPGVQRWQHRLTPVQRLVAGGCHLDRDIAALIAGAGFSFAGLEHSAIDNLPGLAGYCYRGLATA
jgi:ubiquinone/menaquinone biosynthesis C-methylase UbiE